MDPLTAYHGCHDIGLEILRFLGALKDRFDLNSVWFAGDLWTSSCCANPLSDRYYCDRIATI